MMQRAPFITGSMAYGKPTDTSDIDLVVLVDEDALVILKLGCSSHIPIHGGGSGQDDPLIGQRGASLVFGKSKPGTGVRAINLIAVTQPEQYDVWRYCTDFMKEEAAKTGPVSREKAKAFIKKKLAKLEADNGRS